MSLDWHATTILSVRRGDRVALGGDGQVTLGTTVMKADAVKIRRLLDGKVLVGFAGSAADGFALLERFEAKLQRPPGQRAPRRDRAGQGLADRPGAAPAGGRCSWSPTPRHSLLVSGTGDVIQPTDGILAIGSGGGYALAAARALVAHTEPVGRPRSSASRSRSPPGSTSTPTAT